jgi:hypothetical protein
MEVSGNFTPLPRYPGARGNKPLPQYPLNRDTRWRSWLRHGATRRKVAGSIPDGVNGIFHVFNPDSTQPLIFPVG